MHILKKWQGAAGVCLNEQGNILMVLQGTAEEEKKWAIPSGGLDVGETFAECCIREIFEETGYEVKVIKKLHTKEEKINEELEIEVHYFMVRVIGGEKNIQDPDGLIYDIGWKSADDIRKIELSFPEDKSFILDLMAQYTCT